jgi:excisionase family DNA binding protein
MSLIQPTVTGSPDLSHEGELQVADTPVLLLRVEDAAEKLGIARTMMYRLVGSGEVASVRVGRLRRVPVASLEAYVERLLAGRDEGGAGR